VLFWPAVSGLGPSLLATPAFDLRQTPLRPRALSLSPSTRLPATALPALTFKRETSSCCPSLVSNPFLFTIPIELARFAFVNQRFSPTWLYPQCLPVALFPSLAQALRIKPYTLDSFL
jgi:hypothetical protein